MIPQKEMPFNWYKEMGELFPKCTVAIISLLIIFHLSLSIIKDPERLKTQGSVKTDPLTLIRKFQFQNLCLLVQNKCFTAKVCLQSFCTAKTL